MKADKRLSNERLDLEIDKRQSWLRENVYWLDKTLLDGLQEVVSMLVELQTRRAAEQASLPAVEEMAEKLVEFTYDSIDCPEAGVIEFNRMSAMAEVTAAITPLYAKLAEYAEVLDARNGALLYAKTGATFAAALAALVQAEEKEEGK